MNEDFQNLEKKTSLELSHKIVETFGLIETKAKLFNLSLKPSELPIDDQLNKLSLKKARNVLQSLTQLLHTFTTCEIKTLDPWSNREFLQLSLKELGVTCPTDFIDTLTEDELVEAYNMEQIQIFRNMRYMEVCGYSLVEVLTYDWPTLYERSQVITNQLFKGIEAALKTAATVRLDIAPHYMKERMSHTRQMSQVDFQRMTPLFSGPGKLAGFLVSSRARVVDAHPERHDLRFL